MSGPFFSSVIGSFRLSPFLWLTHTTSTWIWSKLEYPQTMFGRYCVPSTLRRLIRAQAELDGLGWWHFSPRHGDKSTFLYSSLISRLFPTSINCQFFLFSLLNCDQFFGCGILLPLNETILTRTTHYVRFDKVLTTGTLWIPHYFRGTCKWHIRCLNLSMNVHHSQLSHKKVHIPLVNDTNLHGFSLENAANLNVTVECLQIQFLNELSIAQTR